MENSGPHSPIPVKKNKEGMSFPDAIREILNGRRITRLSWNPKENSYGLLKDSFLTIFVKGEFHPWLVNDGDMGAIDWIVLSELS